jgi:hypothetical protein
MEDSLSRKNFWIGIACFFFAVFLVPLTFAKPKLTEYAERKASECAVTAQRSGLVIGVQPIENSYEQLTLFNIDLSSKGYISVYIVLENGSSRDSFLFDKTDIGYATIPRDGGGSSQAGSAGLDVIKLISGSLKIQEILLKKQVHSMTLSPGESVHGFLYIPVSAGASRQKVHLQVPIIKAGTSETHVLNLIF